MSIRLRLALLFTAAALVLLVGGGVLFVKSLQSRLEQSLTATLSTRWGSIGSQLAATRAPLTLAAARGAGVLRSVNGTYAQLLTSSGQAIATSRSIADQPLLSAAQTRAARRQTVVFDQTITLVGSSDVGAEPMRVFARRIQPSGNVLVVALSRDVVDQAVSGARDQLLRLGVAVLLLAGPGSWLLTRAALRPVERMVREVRQLDARNAGTGVRVPQTRDEIARLAQTFNSLLAHLHATLAREQTLVADAGHELRTPLTVLKGELELAMRPGRTRDELAGTVQIAAEETDRLVRLTEDLLFLSDEQRTPPAEEFDAVEVAHRAIASVSRPAAQRRITVDLDADRQIQCCGNPDWIRRAVENLLTNALRHGPAGSTVTVRIRADGPLVCVVITDQGCGFSSDFLPRAFDRFSRADTSRVRNEPDGAEAAGNGLGLAIVRSIIERHGGTASAANRPTGGAEVTLIWPRRIASYFVLKNGSSS